MKFAIDEAGAARIFVMNSLAQTGPLDESDAVRLGAVIRMFSSAAWHQALEEAKEVYSQLHPGGCRILSKGDNCDCFLCKMDKLHSKVET